MNVVLTCQHAGCLSRPRPGLVYCERHPRCSGCGDPLAPAAAETGYCPSCYAERLAWRRAVGLARIDPPDGR